MHRPSACLWQLFVDSHQGSAEFEFVSLQVDRAVELTVQHVAKLRDMSPLWEMVQVRSSLYILSPGCLWHAAYKAQYISMDSLIDTDLVGWHSIALRVVRSCCCRKE